MINNRYEIISELGKGRSKVYLCRDSDFGNKEVAVKFLSPDASEEEWSLFKDEFFILQKLEHPGIIISYEIGTAVKVDPGDPVEVGSPFITLEFFKSVELSKYEGPIDESKVKEILKQICCVLYYLHQSNYIYYDLKPENILVSSENDSLQIKLIDLGLAEFIPDREEHVIKGTAQYIAPELLKKESHDHRIDLYSLGMLLYEIIYQRLPFDVSDEIGIYKAQVEREFDFPELPDFSPGLITITKKLLKKDPTERYQNTLQVIADLEMEVSSNIYQNFMPAKVFCGRDDLINILTLYINDKSSSEVFTIKGFDGAGRSSLMNRMHEKFSNSVLISNTQGISGIDRIKFIIKKITYSNQVYLNLNENDKKHIDGFIENSQKNFVEELHSVLSIITAKSKFILLIDDYNLFDQFADNIVKEMIPSFQVNSIKVIISESSDFDYSSKGINNLREISIGSFVERQLSEYLQLAFYNKFPREALKDLILGYADLLPGNIIDFIRDMININIIIFNPDNVVIEKKVEELSTIEGSITAIYDMRLGNLNNDELNLAKLISVFESNQEQAILKKLMGLEQNELSDLLSSLQINNIIQSFSANTVPVISSDGLKKHIYSLIEDKREFHFQLAEAISSSGITIGRNEFARQYELAGEFEKALRIWKEELQNAEEISAYSYARTILTHTLELQLSDTDKNEMRYLLVGTYFRLNDYNSVLENIDKVNTEKLTSDKALELFVLKGSSQINSGNLEEGMELLNSLLSEVQDEFRKNNLLVEIAYAQFDLNKFDEAYELGNSILESEYVSDVDRGRIHNLLGMCIAFNDEKSDDALRHLEMSLSFFTKADLVAKIASAEVNLGIINNIRKNKEKAEYHWNKALESSLSIGDLYQEALILINTGILHFDSAEYEKASVNYERANRIFLSLGIARNQGVALSNLGEAYLFSCEYEKSYSALKEAKEIFEEIKNYEELIPVYLLTAQLYFTIGNEDSLIELDRKVTGLITENKLDERYEQTQRHINLLVQLCTNKDSADIDEIIDLRNSYFSNEKIKNYLSVQVILINQLFYRKQFHEALKQLNDENYLRSLENNNVYLANREYLLGQLASHLEFDDLLTPIEYYERAYNYLAEQSIVELTWKVLLALAEVYTKRGLHNKAKNFIVYARDLINLIAENIESIQIKSAYLHQKERSAALEKLEIFQKK